jgi:hypothetical protein
MSCLKVARARLAFVVALGAGGLGCHAGAAGGHDFDAAVEVAPEVSEKLPRPDASCPLDAAGGGPCPVNFCGDPQSAATLAVNKRADVGADALCTPGYACVPDGPTDMGRALQLRCVAPLAGAVAFGAACATGAGAASRCKNDALCVESADAPGAKFCSQLCRADADCPEQSFCVEHASDKLPNGSFVNLGLCTPKARITGKACVAEAECGAGEGCVSYGSRTSLLVCRDLGGTKSLGEACSSAAECRSGECLDRDNNPPPPPGVVVAAADLTRTFCAGRCRKNSDCGADQRCVRFVVNNNGTIDDATDDVVTGYCRSLFVPKLASACTNNGACTKGGDTCDPKYGVCYKAGAVTGAPCASALDCELGAVCTTGQFYMGGYCQTFGCAAGAAAGPDACSGAASTCSQRASDAPLDACYEGCSKTRGCSRAAESYGCSPVDQAQGTPDTLCLYSKGP